MADIDALFWSHLNILTTERYRALIDVFGSFADARKFLGEEMLKGMGCRADTVRTVLMRAEEFDAKATLAGLEHNDIRFLTLDDDAYPARLKTIHDPPVFLYARGDLSILDQPTIAVVGTRGMTQAGRRVTQMFVPRFVQAGLVTVSGLALGVDGLAAEETMRAGGTTVAVLGSGLDVIYPPSHQPLAEKIVASGGLLLSEYPPTQSPERFTFPGRNRIIAGLSLGTLVIEAPAKSGALITAEFALDEARDVFAVPGDVFAETFAGSNALIAKGHAALVVSPDDVLSGLGIIAPATVTDERAAPDDPDQAAIWSSLTTLPQDFDDLVQRAKLSADRVNTALTMLELNGRVRNVGAGQWVKFS